MLQNAYLIAKIGADTAENKQNLPKISKICRTLATTLRSSAVVRSRDEEFTGSSRGVPGFSSGGEYTEAPPASVGTTNLSRWGPNVKLRFGE